MEIYNVKERRGKTPRTYYLLAGGLGFLIFIVLLFSAKALVIGFKFLWEYWIIIIVIIIVALVLKKILFRRRHIKNEVEDPYR